MPRRLTDSEDPRSDKIAAVSVPERDDADLVVTCFVRLRRLLAPDEDRTPLFAHTGGR